MKGKKGLRVSLVTLDIDGVCWRIIGLEMGLLYISLFLVLREI